MLSTRSLLLLLLQLLLVVLVAGRPQADRQDVSDTQAKRIQDLKYILDQLNPSRFLGQSLPGQLALEQSEAALLPGKAQKRAVLRKRQNGTDVSSIDTVPTTTTAEQPPTTTPPGTTAEPPPSTTAAPPTSSQGETGDASSSPPSSGLPPSSSPPHPSSDVQTTPPAPTTPSPPTPPTQQPGPTQEPGPTQAPGPTTPAPPTTTPLPPVVLPPSGGGSSEGGAGNTGSGGQTGGAPAPPPSSIDVPVTTTDGQGNTVVSTTRAPAPPSVTEAPSSFAGEINVVTTDDEGQPITLSSVSFGEVITTTGRGGRTFVTTFTPAGGRVSSIVLQTTTLPNGQRSTITSFAPVAQATNNPSQGSPASSADASLQTGAAPLHVLDGRLAAVAGGLIGLAQLL